MLMSQTGTMDSQNKNYNNYQMQHAGNQSSQHSSNIQPINGKYSVYIANLHPDTTEDEIQSFFLILTPPLGVKLLLDSEGKSRRCGFVYYATYEEAKKAIDTLNGQFTDKNSKFPLKLSFYEPNKNKNNNNMNQRYNNSNQNSMMMMNMNRQKIISMNNNDVPPMLGMQNPAQGIQLLSQVMTDPNAIMNLLSQAAQVNVPIQNSFSNTMPSANMNHMMGGNVPILDPNTNMNLYSTTTLQHQTLMNQSSMDNQTVNPQYDVRCKVYVCPIDNTIDDDWLREKFSAAGNIEAVKSMPDGYGFVTYSTPQMALVATQTLHNKYTNSKGDLISVTLKTAKSKNRPFNNNNTMNMQRNFNGPMNHGMNQGMSYGVNQGMNQGMNNPRYNNYSNFNNQNRSGPIRNNFHNNNMSNNMQNKKFTPY